MTPQEQAKEWMSKLKAETRTIDREFRSIEREEDKLKTQIKAAAKKGERTAATVMAKGIVRSRRTVERMMMTKTQINSTIVELKQQSAMLKVSSVLGQNVNVMRLMNQLVSVPQISATMREMQQQMMRTGLIGEMVAEAIESVDDADLETDADAEVEAALFEVTMGVMGQAAVVEVRDRAALAVSRSASRLFSLGLFSHSVARSLFALIPRSALCAESQGGRGASSGR
jgi:charged multivesicular body protein 3